MIDGFSKLTKSEKIDWLCKHYFSEEASAKDRFEQYFNSNEALQKRHDEFIENTVGNYYMPFAVAPNFLINGKTYTVPMVIEESSVVAAASRSAKFWQTRGGFQAEVISTEKNGQVHFMFYGNVEDLEMFFDKKKPLLLKSTSPLTTNMEKRGGGITDLFLVNKTKELPHYFQLYVAFETADAMGANFINSCLEELAKTLRIAADKDENIGKDLEIVMSILSNYVPECLVRSKVSCPVQKLSFASMDANIFAEKFVQAIAIANAEVHRATTHNKGVMNGIDAVVLATGNDFRAVEAGVHAYASRSGRYQCLTNAWIEDDVFHFQIEVPLALGTVGGLTKLHPMAETALKILENPTAQELMMIVASVGLAQNFAAVGALITSGIQKGHMKMHLMNILNQLEATDDEKKQALCHFSNKTVTYNEVAQLIKTMRE